MNNDSEFIIKTVDNLTNYYKKNEIYTQEQVNTLISNVNSFNVDVVQTLPTENIDTHTIYLVPKEAETNDNYDEYIYINNSWEHIGSTSADLTNYYSKNEIDIKLESKANTTDLESKQNTLVSGTNIKTINNNSLLGEGNIDLNSIPVSATPPENPEDGALWVDTDDEGVIVEVDQEVNSGSTNAVSNSAITNYVNGVSLYTGGSKENITLSDSAANYAYLEIFFNANNYYNSVKVYSPNNKNVYLSVNVVNADASYFQNKIVLINGTSISNVVFNQNTVGSSVATENANNIYITKVIGYKEV